MRRFQLLLFVLILSAATGMLCGSVRVVVQSGHQAAVWDLSYDATGRLLFSAGHDKVIKVWNPADGVLIRDLFLHSNSITKIRPLGSDGRMVSTGADSRLCIWNSSDGRLTATAPGAAKHINQLGCSRDGRYIVTGGGDGWLRLRDGRSGKVIRRFRTPGSEISAAAVNRQGTMLAAIAFPHEKVLLYRVDGAAPAAAVPVKGVQQLVFTAAGDRLLLGLEQGAVAVMRTGGTRLKMAVQADTGAGSVRKMKLSADGTGLAVLEQTGRVLVYATDDFRVVFKSESSDFSGANALALSPDNGSVAVGNTSGEIRVFRLDGGEQVISTATAGASHESAAYAVSGNRLALLFSTAGFSEVLLDLNNGTVQRFDPAEISMNNAAAFTPDGRALFATGWSGVCRWNISTERINRSWKAGEEMAFQPAVSPDGRHLAVPRSDKKVVIRTAAEGRELKVLAGFGDLAGVAAYSPDGRYLAAGSADRSVRIYSVPDYRSVLTRYNAHWNSLEDLVFSPDSSRLFTGCTSGWLRIWSVPRMQMLRSVRAFSVPLTALAVSPDGRLIAAGADNGRIRIWEAASGRERSVPPVLTSRIQLLFFVKGSRFLCGVANYGFVRIWDLEQGKQLDIRFLRNGKAVFVDSRGKYYAMSGLEEAVKLYTGNSRFNDQSGEYSNPQIVQEFFR